LVVLVPVMLLVLLLGIQAALWFHAANVATAAASQGAAAASVPGGTSSTGASTARRTVLELGGRLASEPGAVVTAETVWVAVHLQVPRIVPFFPTSVRRVVTEPRERFIPESQR
jgi:hypothetical protein